jgi:hypothetical protein
MLLAVWTLQAAAAETVVYELYRVSKGGRELIEKGVKKYQTGDIEVSASWVGPRFWQKELALNDRFAIGGSVHRHKELVGFGLWLKQRPRWFEVWSDGGFSWDWFNRENAVIYRKLQGPGRVKATIVTGSGYEELTAVEFLDDITLRLKARPWFFFGDEDTHHVVVRKGSVLKLAP